MVGRLYSQGYRKLSQPHESRSYLGEMILRLYDYYSGAQAYVVSTTEETGKFHLTYSGTDVALLSDKSQRIEVNLVHKDGKLALTGYRFAGRFLSTYVFFQDESI